MADDKPFFERGSALYDALSEVERRGLEPERGGRLADAAAEGDAVHKVLALRSAPPRPGEDWLPEWARDSDDPTLEGSTNATRRMVADLAADYDPSGTAWASAVRTARDDAWADAGSLREQIEAERARQKAETAPAAGANHATLSHVATSYGAKAKRVADPTAAGARRVPVDPSGREGANLDAPAFFRPLSAEEEAAAAARAAEAGRSGKRPSDKIILPDGRTSPGGYDSDDFPFGNDDGDDDDGDGDGGRARRGSGRRHYRDAHNIEQSEFGFAGTDETKRPQRARKDKTAASAALPHMNKEHDEPELPNGRAHGEAEDDAEGGRAHGEASGGKREARRGHRGKVNFETEQAEQPPLRKRGIVNSHGLSEGLAENFGKEPRPRPDAGGRAGAGSRRDESQIDAIPRKGAGPLGRDGKQRYGTATSSLAPEFMQRGAEPTRSPRLSAGASADEEDEPSAGRAPPSHPLQKQPPPREQHISKTSDAAPAFMRRGVDEDAYDEDDEAGARRRADDARRYAQIGRKKVVSDDGRARDNLATSPGAPRFMKDAAEGEGEPQGRHGKRDGYDAFDAGGGVRTLVGDRVGDAAGSGRKGHVAHSAIVSPGAPAFMKRSVEQAGEGGGRYGGVRAQLEAVADGDGATPSKGLRTHIAHGADEHSAGRRAGATVVSAQAPAFFKSPGAGARGQLADDEVDEYAAEARAAPAGSSARAASEAPYAYTQRDDDELSSAAGGYDADHSTATGRTRRTQPPYTPEPVDGATPSRRVHPRAASPDPELVGSMQMGAVLGGGSAPTRTELQTSADATGGIAQEQHGRADVLLAGLPPDTTAKQLGSHLRKLKLEGDVASVNVLSDQLTGNAIGGVVTFKNLRTDGGADSLASAVGSGTRFKAQPISASDSIQLTRGHGSGPLMAKLLGSKAGGDGGSASGGGGARSQGVRTPPRTPKSPRTPSSRARD